MFIIAKQNDRVKFRNYVMVNCVTALLSRGVPKDILKK